MADVISVEPKALAGIYGGLKALHGELVKAGSSMQKDFRGAHLFERSSPIEAIACGLESCVLTATELTKAAGSASASLVKSAEDMKAQLAALTKERDDAVAYAEKALDRAEHYAHDEVDCPVCFAKAKTTKEGEAPAGGEGAGQMECPMCGGSGYVSRKKASAGTPSTLGANKGKTVGNALQPGGAFRAGKLPGRGSSVRAAV